MITLSVEPSPSRLGEQVDNAGSAVDNESIAGLRWGLQRWLCAGIRVYLA